MKRSADSPLLSIEKVADRCDVSVRTVRRWIAGRELVAHKLGRQWRVSEADLATFLAIHRGANLVSDDGH